MKMIGEIFKVDCGTLTESYKSIQSNQLFRRGIGLAVLSFG